MKIIDHLAHLFRPAKVDTVNDSAAAGGSVYAEARAGLGVGSVVVARHDSYFAPAADHLPPYVSDAGSTQPLRISDSLTLAQQRVFDWLLPVIDTPGVRDIFLQMREDRPQLWADIDGQLQRLPAPSLRPQQMRDFACALIAAGGRQLDELHPAQNVSVGCGLRVHAVLAPIAVSGAAVSIRVPSVRQLSFDELVSSGICDADTAARLRSAVRERENILITGGTGTGKTTLLRALLDLAPESQRIVTIEDIAEITLTHQHHVRLESREANSEASGEITLNELLKQALRMRPDRLVLGECRGAELATMLNALNTGHRGGASTVHCASITDLPARIAAMGALAGLDDSAVAKQFVAAIDLIVQLERVQGVFRITQLGVPELNPHGQLQITAFTPEAQKDRAHADSDAPTFLKIVGGKNQRAAVLSENEDIEASVSELNPHELELTETYLIAK